MESTQLQKRLYKLLRLKNLYLSHCGRASNHLGAWVSPSLRFVPPTLADQVCATTVTYGLLIFFCEFFPSSNHHSHRSKSLLGVQQDITAVCNSIQRWMACASFSQSYEEQIFSYFRITNSKFPLYCSICTQLLEMSINQHIYINVPETTRKYAYIVMVKEDGFKIYWWEIRTIILE